jgi:hypothetical protein
MTAMGGWDDAVRVQQFAGAKSPEIVAATHSVRDLSRSFLDGNSQ